MNPTSRFSSPAATIRGWMLTPGACDVTATPKFATRRAIRTRKTCSGPSSLSGIPRLAELGSG